ncbi:hypothetical protein, partial [Salmonella sp. s51933]|uniref:hypothetical protein n=1 Tax=Salmonella sp. s51933 TaxID=3160127 RepID=UPI003754DCD6
MREHVVKQVDSDRDNFVSYDEFVGATNDKEYEKPDEGWKGIDDEKEFTDDEFAQYEKEFADEDDEEEEEDGENHSPDPNEQPHNEIPLADEPEQKDNDAENA